MKLKLSGKLLLVGFVAMLSVILIARDVFSIAVSKFILLGICAAFLFVADDTIRISMISFLLPLMCGIPSTYVLFCIMGLLLLRNRLSITTVLYFSIFILLEFLGLAFGSTMLNSEVVKQILFVCIFFALLFTTEKVNYLQCMSLYFVGAILVCGVIVAYSLMRAPSDWLSLFSKGWYRFGDVALEDVQGMTLRLNSNSLAYFSLTGLFQGIILLTKEKGLKRWFVLSGTGFLAVAGILSVSRSWILVMLGCLGLFLISHLTNPKRILLISSVLVVFVGIGYFVAKTYPELLQGIITRMTHSSMEGGNGRVELMTEYADLLFGDLRMLLFGSGATYYRTAYGMTTSIHNGTLQIFLAYGIVGGSIFILGMVFSLRKGYATGRSSLIFWLPLIATVVFAQTIQFLNPCYLMLPYIIAVYAVRYGRMT